MKVKLNTKTNLILIIIELICIIVILKYFFLNKYDLIKTIVIFQNNKSDLYIDLSVGYTCSYFFYLLQIYIPEKIKKQKFYKKNNLTISQIINTLKEIIICLQNFYVYSENKYVTCSDKKYIILKIPVTENKKEYWSIKINRKEFFQHDNLLNSVVKKIEKLKEDILYSFIDVETMEYFDGIIDKCIELNKNLFTDNLIEKIGGISCNAKKYIEYLNSAVKKLEKICCLEKRNYEIANIEEEKIFDKYYQERIKIIKGNVVSGRILIKVNYENDLDGEE